MSTLFHEHLPRLLAGLSVVLLTAACASTPPKSAAQIEADRALANAVFTIAKGGAMVQAAVAGQKFTYKPKAAS